MVTSAGNPAFTGVILPDDSASVGHSALTSLRNPPTPRTDYVDHMHSGMENIPSVSGPHLATLEADESVAQSAQSDNPQERDIQRSLFSFEVLNQEGEDHNRGGSDDDGEGNGTVSGTAEVQIDPTIISSIPDTGAAAGDSMLSLPETRGGLPGEDGGLGRGEMGLGDGLVVTTPSGAETSVEGTALSEDLRGFRQEGSSAKEPGGAGGVQEQECERQGSLGAERDSQSNASAERALHAVQSERGSSGGASDRDFTDTDSGKFPVLRSALF